MAIFNDINVSNTFDTTQDVVLLTSDVLEALKDIPLGFCKLIISSPPYNIGKSYEKKLSLDDYVLWQEVILKELVRIMSPYGSIVWQVGNFVDKGEVFPLDIYFYPIFKKLGLQLRNRIIWHFEHGLHASKRFSGRYETLLWFTKTSEYTFNLDPVRVPSKYPGKRAYKGVNKGKLTGNPLGKNPSDFWDFIYAEFEKGIINIPNVKSNHPEKTMHPCQYPIELVERFVLSLTNVHDWVLDPFSGSGSSAIAAIKHQRKSICIDKEPEYIALTYKRIRDFNQGMLKIRPLGKQIHIPSGKDKVSQKPPEWDENNALFNQTN